MSVFHHPHLLLGGPKNGIQCGTGAQFPKCSAISLGSSHPKTQPETPSDVCGIWVPGGGWIHGRGDAPSTVLLTSVSFMHFVAVVFCLHCCLLSKRASTTAPPSGLRVVAMRTTCQPLCSALLLGCCFAPGRNYLPRLSTRLPKRTKHRDWASCWLDAEPAKEGTHTHSELLSL